MGNTKKLKNNNSKSFTKTQQHKNQHKGRAGVGAPFKQQSHGKAAIAKSKAAQKHVTSHKKNTRKEKEFWSDFLDLYKSMPCLWKIQSEDYTNRVLKNSCYLKMVEKLSEIDPDANREKVVKKINTFRTNYKRELRKVKRSEKCGEGLDDIFISSLWYFDKLRFLENQERSQERRCSMENSDQSEVIPQPTKKKYEENTLLQLASQKLPEVNNGDSALARGWANQYAELSAEQKIFARSIIADTLFHGCLNKLNESIAEYVHKVFKGDPVQAQSRFVARATTPDTYDVSYSSQYEYSPPSTHGNSERGFSPERKYFTHFRN